MATKKKNGTKRASESEGGRGTESILNSRQKPVQHANAYVRVCAIERKTEREKERQAHTQIRKENDKTTAKKKEKRRRKTTMNTKNVCDQKGFGVL